MRVGRGDTERSVFFLDDRRGRNGRRDRSCRQDPNTRPTLVYESRKSRHVHLHLIHFRGLCKSKSPLCILRLSEIEPSHTPIPTSLSDEREQFAFEADADEEKRFDLGFNAQVEQKCVEDRGGSASSQTTTATTRTSASALPFPFALLIPLAIAIALCLLLPISHIITPSSPSTPSQNHIHIHFQPLPNYNLDLSSHPRLASEVERPSISVGRVRSVESRRVARETGRRWWVGKWGMRTCAGA